LRLADEIISLPMFPQLTAQQQAKVVYEIQSFTLSSLDAPAELGINPSVQVGLTA